MKVRYFSSFLPSDRAAILDMWARPDGKKTVFSQWGCLLLRAVKVRSALAHRSAIMVQRQVRAHQARVSYNLRRKFLHRDSATLAVQVLTRALLAKVEFTSVRRAVNALALQVRRPMHVLLQCLRTLTARI